MNPEKINDNISIYQNPASLAFGTDAYLLSAYIKKHAKARACELGCGSGVISLLVMARDKLAHITGIEIQEAITFLGSKNVAENGFQDKIDIINRDIRQLDGSLNGKFDVVFTNPPYMKTGSGIESENEADRISRREIFGTIFDFASCASSLLKFGGLFYSVYRPDRISDLFSALNKSCLEPKRMTLVYPTAEHIPCLVLIEAKKGASSGLFVTRPLIIYKSRDNMVNENYTDDMKYIYENGDFNEQFKKSR
jgi:tRNA1(Val) A37 N6-methylase TrmN6